MFDLRFHGAVIVWLVLMAALAAVFFLACSHWNARSNMTAAKGQTDV